MQNETATEEKLMHTYKLLIKSTNANLLVWSNHNKVQHTKLSCIVYTSKAQAMVCCCLVYMNSSGDGWMLPGMWQIKQGCHQSTAFFYTRIVNTFVEKHCAMMRWPHIKERFGLLPTAFCGHNSLLSKMSI